MIPTERREKAFSNSNSDTIPQINLLSLGYSKVLGRGRLPKAKFVLRTRYITAEAEKKVTEAGGVIQLVASMGWEFSRFYG